MSQMKEFRAHSEVQGVLAGLRAPLEPGLILILGRLLWPEYKEQREKEKTEAETRRDHVSEHEKMVARGGNRRMGTIWTWARLRL